MRLVERSADNAFELELNSTRLLLDFSSPPHRPLLRYVPVSSTAIIVIKYSGSRRR